MGAESMETWTRGRPAQGNYGPMTQHGTARTAIQAHQMVHPRSEHVVQQLVLIKQYIVSHNLAISAELPTEEQLRTMAQHEIDTHLLQIKQVFATELGVRGQQIEAFIEELQRRHENEIEMARARQAQENLRVMEHVSEVGQHLSLIHI